MAIKHVVTQGSGFEPINFMVTKGYGDLSASSGGSGATPEATGLKFSFGIGPMGKPSVHPHPVFSRHKH